MADQLSLSGKPIKKYERNKAHVVYKLQNGQRVPGCSTICKIGDDSSGLMNWAYNCGREGIDFNKARDEAADIGSATHFLIETFLKEQEADLSAFSGDVIKKANSGFDKFFLFWSANGFKPYCSESQLTSHMYEYGGTLDCVARDPEDRLCLLDFKVTTGHWPSHGFQLAGYRNLFEESHAGEKIEKFVVVRIPKTSAPVDPRWFPNLESEWNVFLAQLNLYNELRRAKKSR